MKRFKMNVCVIISLTILLLGSVASAQQCVNAGFINKGGFDFTGTDSFSSSPTVSTIEITAPRLVAFSQDEGYVTFSTPENDTVKLIILKQENVLQLETPEEKIITIARGLCSLDHCRLPGVLTLRANGDGMLTVNLVVNGRQASGTFKFPNGGKSSANTYFSKYNFDGQMRVCN